MRVIKIGGRAQRDPALYAAIADAWRRQAGSICLVHGGGDEISALQRAFGIEPRFADGRRITGERDIDILRMTLSGSSNKRVVAALQDAGVRAIGISGEDGALIGAEITRDERLGLVGTPVRIDVAILSAIISAGFLPVISPLGRSMGDGRALNINGDDAAAAIAGALRAQELLLVADVPGVLVNGDAAERLSKEDAEALVQAGTATGGMIAKLEAALLALSSGVASVRIGSAQMLGDPRSGTTITPTPSLV
jgi:acetylglutamate kinase